MKEALVLKERMKSSEDIQKFADSHEMTNRVTLRSKREIFF